MADFGVGVAGGVLIEVVKGIYEHVQVNYIALAITTDH